MTIKRPKRSIADRLLHALGKKRGIILPDKSHEDYGPHVYAVAEKECFWKALLRPKGESLPQGMTDLTAFLEILDGRNRKPHKQ